jgi:hypothetical protein
MRILRPPRLSHRQTPSESWHHAGDYAAPLQGVQARQRAEVKWTNTPAGSDKPIQSGEIKADAHGRVTVPAARVGKARNRIVIEKP